MALSCTSLAGRLSLSRLFGIRIISTTSGFCSPLAPHQPRLLCRFHASSKVKQGVGRHVASRLQRANTKYESFLQKRFPTFHQLYHTFVEGFRLLYRDGKEVLRIKAKMSIGVKRHNLPYREMEKLRQFRRDIIKAIPLVLISSPPFANYLVFVLMYFFPRQLLIPHFWTPVQQVEFRQAYHSLRAKHHMPVLKALQHVSEKVQESQQRHHLRNLCSKVQNGENPKVSEILAVQRLFSGPPLGIKRLSVAQVRHISPLLFLTPRLPGFLVRRRLNSHALELLQLDRALNRLGPHQLSDSELRQACYVRGLNSDAASASQCREWLYQWLQVSSSLKESEVSLLLHNMVFLSANYALMPEAAPDSPSFAPRGGK